MIDISLIRHYDRKVDTLIIYINHLSLEVKQVKHEFNDPHAGLVKFKEGHRGSDNRPIRRS